MPNLRTDLAALANSFADAVLAAIRGASLDDLLAESSAAPRRGPGRPRRQATKATQPAPRGPSAPRTKEVGRKLARRSSADVEKTLTLVIAMLTADGNKGARSEDIQKFLKLDKRELPRVLKTGLAKKVLRSRGRSERLGTSPREWACSNGVHSTTSPFRKGEDGRLRSR
jgi:hypothetical protein